MAFSANDAATGRYPARLYTDFLDYIQNRYGGEFWLAHPSEVARYWRGLKSAEGPNPIPVSPIFCSGCREAHAAGWMNSYSVIEAAETARAAGIVPAPGIRDRSTLTDTRPQRSGTTGWTTR